MATSGRDFKRNMKRSNPATQEQRFFLSEHLGIRVFRHVANTTRKPLTQTVSKLSKFRDIDKNQDNIKSDYGIGGPLSHFGAIVGIDLGHVYSAAAFALPTDVSKPGSQVKISNNYLYGHQWRNSALLEKRKTMCGIADLEEDISKLKKHGATLAGCVSWVRAWQRKKSGLPLLPTFITLWPWGISCGTQKCRLPRRWIRHVS